MTLARIKLTQNYPAQQVEQGHELFKPASSIKVTPAKPPSSLGHQLGPKYSNAQVYRHIPPPPIIPIPIMAIITTTFLTYLRKLNFPPAEKLYP